MATELTGYIHWVDIMECKLKVTAADGEDHIIPFDMGDNGENYRRWVGFTSRDAKLILEEGEVKEIEPVE